MTNIIDRFLQDQNINTLSYIAEVLEGRFNDHCLPQFIVEMRRYMTQEDMTTLLGMVQAEIEKRDNTY